MTSQLAPPESLKQDATVTKWVFVIYFLFFILFILIMVW